MSDDAINSIHRLMNIVERMVDLQDRMCNQINDVVKEVESLRERLDEYCPEEQDTRYSRVN